MRLSDPKAIRALAHPIRLDLLETLGKIGPATAASCGRVLGVSQASCSFHLRQLAKYGFVEDAGPGSDRRERRWQVADRQMLLADSAQVDPLVAQQLSRVVVEREAARALDWVGRTLGESAQWRDAARGMAATVRVTAVEAAEIKAQWRAILAPYLTRDAAQVQGAAPDAHADDRRHVRYFMAASPLADTDLGDSTDDH
ncbi:helix-turn-helix domain-containing protein [Streptomyces sp. G-G2]|uniref:winged helix-turn-helix domain-containing protein n=1 Tax=Streptomyces sp. G-G2 TaxID=3046201 RepID=UPI0024BB5219|nr:helix-turn-helix domain-containing protein [Streptomyces sp. G-G2]MDJ0385290.1 helix-turn-helix domain-containing protein [Streptomyces sp. G-G2]